MNKFLDYTKSFEDEQIVRFSREIGYGDKEDIIINKIDKTIIKRVYMFPRVFMTSLTNQEKINLRKFFKEYEFKEESV